ncbi:MAG: hypothetical protein QOF51_3767 [Chloroflexota bacterium]|jgi:uncharacterized protein (DUF427 family)|nr:hypothetical protein [Chloroflexota bacterium]
MAQTATPPVRQRDPNHRVDVEPSPRRVRVEFNGQTIADSTRVLLLRETRHLPVYYFPMDDVRMELLTPTDNHTTCPYKGEASYWTIKVGDRESVDAVWGYLDPPPDRQDIKGHLAFYWDRMDHWYEEAEEVFKHPRDPYHRVDAIQSSRHVRIVVNGETVADTARPCLLFETGHPTRYYIPQDDVRMDLLAPTETHSVCPYKGQASYWSANVNGEAARNIAWGYLNPIAECPKIKGLVSFFNEKVDVYVDGELQERPVTGWSNRTVE